ncbi:MAG TPA: tetratricopeptide repeat protein [Candidatus Paceibacterota bacterium]|nr:tetratricopeptide repeat protein [Verrucomicrobiota bacterium]HRY50510.1 tetratricopeptide repeat protein [Candidatus Paceibacterota bacterium]
MASKRLNPKGESVKTVRIWVKRFLAIVLVPLVVVVGLELVLRLVGFGYPTSFFLADRDAGVYFPNNRYGWFFQKAGVTRPHPCRIGMPKPAGTVRVFVLGESAAMGFPDASFGFARVLEVMLRNQWPDCRIEMVNAALRGINSHVVRRIARECAALEPDLFVIYLGNNEVVGLYGPGRHAGYLTPFLSGLRLHLELRLTRVGQLFWRALRGSSDAPHTPQQKQDMEFFRQNRVALDDWRRQAVYRNFKANLDDILRTTVKSGAPVVLVTVGANLKDFPPLGSLHKPGLTAAQLEIWNTWFKTGIQHENAGDPEEALRQYDQAMALDDHYAELMFRSARCHLALGRTNQAASLFARARDLDAMQFRSDTAVNEVIRQLASHLLTERLALCDVEKALGEGDSNRSSVIPGLDYFQDHVHYRFDGDYAVAKKLFPLVTHQLSQRLPQLTDRVTPPLTREECARRLGLTLWDEIQLLAPAVELTRKPPFLDQVDHDRCQAAAEQWLRQEQKRIEKVPASQYLQTYDYAIRLAPDDWMLRHNYAVLLNAMEQKRAAAKQMEWVVRALPQVDSFRVAYGYLLAETGRLKEAEEEFNTALKIRPESNPARTAIEWLAQKRLSSPASSDPARSTSIGQ